MGRKDKSKLVHSVSEVFGPSLNNVVFYCLTSKLEKGGSLERSAILTTTINLPFSPKASWKVGSVLYGRFVLNHQDTPKHARQSTNLQ
jgi:hypothetical protein